MPLLGAASDDRHPEAAVRPRPLLLPHARHRAPAHRAHHEHHQRPHDDEPQPGRRRQRARNDAGCVRVREPDSSVDRLHAVWFIRDTLKETNSHFCEKLSE